MAPPGLQPPQVTCSGSCLLGPPFLSHRSHLPVSQGQQLLVTVPMGQGWEPGDSAGGKRPPRPELRERAQRKCPFCGIRKREARPWARVGPRSPRSPSLAEPPVCRCPELVRPAQFPRPRSQAPLHHRAGFSSRPGADSFPGESEKGRREWRCPGSVSVWSNSSRRACQVTGVAE